MADEPKDPNEQEEPEELSLCEIFDASILAEYLGILVGWIRERGEFPYQISAEDVSEACAKFKKEFGVTCDSGFRNYVDALEALVEFEKKHNWKQIPVPDPNLYYGWGDEYKCILLRFQELMDSHYFDRNSINRELLTLIIKALYTLC